MIGYAASDYVGYKSFGTAPAGSGLWIGALSIVRGTGGDGVYLRDDVYGATLVILPEGAVGDVLDGPLYDIDGLPWWMVATDYGTGWVHGGYLAATTWAELAAGGGAGQSLANVAMDYINTPYVWGGVTPNGFDCSGFTYYLMTSILGYDFSRVIETQMESGYWVSSDELQPGDLIFFQNTYTWGLSHVGIYIGNGQMISASGEHMAVGVNDLNDPYWSARYLTARRVL
ncbi:MAG: C40 family peptidase [Thermomicrobiales bacterium]